MLHFFPTASLRNNFSSDEYCRDTLVMRAVACFEKKSFIFGDGTVAGGG
jgi:hypothetical protein